MPFLARDLGDPPIELGTWLSDFELVGVEAEFLTSESNGRSDYELLHSKCSKYYRSQQTAMDFQSQKFDATRGLGTGDGTARAYPMGHTRSTIHG